MSGVRVSGTRVLASPSGCSSASLCFCGLFVATPAEPSGPRSGCGRAVVEPLRDRAIARTSATRPPATPRPIMPSRAARFFATLVASSIAEAPETPGPPDRRAAAGADDAAPMSGAAGEAVRAAGPAAKAADFCAGGSEPETGGRPMQPAKASAASAALGYRLAGSRATR